MVRYPKEETYPSNGNWRLLQNGWIHDEFQDVYGDKVAG